MHPVDAARMELRSSWQRALQILRASYDPATARNAWVALLSEPNSGWSTRDPQSGAWRLYCVPGYDAMCGDFNYAPAVSAPQYVYAAPVPAGQVAPTSMTTGEKWVLLFVLVAGAWLVYMLRPESEIEKSEYRRRRQVTA